MNETLINASQDLLNTSSDLLTNFTNPLANTQDISWWDGILNGFMGLGLPMQAVSIIATLLFAIWIFWMARGWIAHIGDLIKYIAVALVVIVILIVVFSSTAIQGWLNIGG